MTEFQRVAKERERMCETSNGCKECPLYNLTEGNFCGTKILNHAEESERIIMKWASEHPIKTNRMKFEEIFGCSIVTHKIHEAIPGHVEILNTSDEEFEEWLNAEYKGGQDG